MPATASARSTRSPSPLSQSGVDQAPVLQLGDPARLRGDALTNAERWAGVGGHWEPFERLPDDAELIVDVRDGLRMRQRLDRMIAHVRARLEADPRPDERVQDRGQA